MSLRKLWLFLNFLSPIFPIFGVGLISYFTSKAIPEQIAHFLLGAQKELRDAFLQNMIHAIILFCCAYRKPGTKYLTFSIVCICFSLAFLIYSVGSTQTSISLLKMTHGSIETIQAMYAFQVFMLSLGLIYLPLAYLSLRLRQDNKQAQFNQVLAHPVYSTAFQSLRSTSDAAELRDKYGELVRKHPEIACYLKRVYKEALSKYAIYTETT
jgi:hypothetical protein